jgi:hypothetical protein
MINLAHHTTTTTKDAEKTEKLLQITGPTL